MSVTSYSLNGSNPDYRCLQTYYVVMPVYARKDVGLRWATLWKPANPRSGGAEQKPRPAGVWTPLRASAALAGVLREYETNGWVKDVDTNMPTGGYDKTAKRIVSVMPVSVTPGHHQYGVSVRAA